MSKSLTGVLLLLFLAFASLAQAKDESYRQAILNSETRASYAAELGQECVNQIVKLYQEGENLSSQYVQSVAVDISAISKRHDKGYPLYHYTNSEFLVQNFLHPSEGFGYPDLLTYQRERAKRGESLNMSGWTNIENTVLYIALNPYTSANYGKNLLTFWLKENSKSISNKILSDRASLAENMIKADRKKFAKLLPKCRSGINLIIFEESGIDLVDYSSHVAPTSQWYYLISTKNIQSHDVLPMKESGPTMQDEQEKDYLRVNTYLRQSARDAEINKQ
ncbi:hypothetical protein [Pseudobdellovibrio sp. HCB154]|uniref:hypothetical protein n=1 Tax=Pseudobdellovibrio sp. HCB154 TaxID=3386277 RepID=UPI003917453D